jgi:hypothetical protein
MTRDTFPLTAALSWPDSDLDLDLDLDLAYAGA